MKTRILYGIWLWLYLLCAALGHIQSPSSGQQIAMTCLAVVFFVPGFYLLLEGWKQKSKKACQTIFYISLSSLLLTVIMLLVNLFSVTGSETLGDVMYVMLIWLSSPMICSGYWFLSLFLWATLLFSAFFCKKKL